MGLSKSIWTNPTEFLRNQQPENPVLFFAPSVVQATARRFLDGFPGLVTYAVKSNPGEEMLENLVAAGVTGFDCASPFEIDLIRRLAPDAAIHYNNPVRSRAEISHAVARGVKSYSVDSPSELLKLIEMVPAAGIEISVRFNDASTGRDYIVRFIDDGTARVDALSTAAHEGLDFVPGKSPGPAHWTVLADLADTLVAWTRDGNPAALVENWTLPADDSQFAKALEEVITEARLVIAKLMGGAPAASTIAAFSARLDLYFDQRGKPVEKIPPVDLEWRFDEWSREPPPPLFNTQKFSVSVAVEPGRYSTRLVLRPQIPDILVEGDVHRRFRRWLLADESIAPLLAQAARRLAQPVINLRRAWDTALEAEGLAVIRIGQHLSGRNRGDADMLLLDLSLADRPIRLALEGRLTLPADDSPIQERWVRLRALHDGSRWQTITGDDDSLLATWAARVFRTLLSIQALRMGNPFVPGEG